MVLRELKAVSDRRDASLERVKRRADDAEAAAEVARKETAAASADQRRLLSGLAAAEAAAENARRDAEKAAADAVAAEAKLSRCKADAVAAAAEAAAEAETAKHVAVRDAVAEARARANEEIARAMKELEVARREAARAAVASRQLERQIDKLNERRVPRATRRASYFRLSLRATRRRITIHLSSTSAIVFEILSPTDQSSSSTWNIPPTGTPRRTTRGCARWRRRLTRVLYTGPHTTAFAW